MDFIYFFNEIVKSIVTIIVGVTTGVILFSWQEAFRQKKESKIILNALLAEVTTLINLLDKQHEYVRKNGEQALANTYYIKVDKNYCKIYDENTGKMGMIDNTKLIKNLVDAYTSIKILFDELQDLEFVAKREIDYNIKHPKGDIVLNKLKHDRVIYLSQIFEESLVVKQKLVKAQALLKKEISKYN